MGARIVRVGPVLLGALGGILGGLHAAPTGWNVADRLWCAAFGAVLVAAGAVAGPVVWLVLAALTLPAAWGDAVAVAAVGVVIAVAYRGLLVEARTRAWGSLAGGLLAIALLRLSWPTGSGATAAFAGAIALGLGFAAVLALEPARRRNVGKVAAVALCGLLAACGVAAASVAAERHRIRDASTAVDAAFEASKSGDVAASSTSFHRAASQLAVAKVRLERPWVWAGRAVPVVGNQLAALDTVVRAASDLTRLGARTADAASSDAVRPNHGRVDLDAIGVVRTSLAETTKSIISAQHAFANARSPWLLGRVDSEITRLSDRASKAQVDAIHALRAADIAPQLLGAGGERRWLLIVVNPSELRGAGGLPGSYGVLRADRGRLKLEVVGKVADIVDKFLDPPVPATGQPEYLARYKRLYDLDRWYQNSTASPHFPYVGETMAQRYARYSGERIDGTIALDPQAFSAMLRLVGPIDVAGWSGSITADNVASILLHDQYVAIDARDARTDFLADVAQKVFNKMLEGGLPQPGRAAAELSPLLPARHVQLWSAKPDEEAWFSSIGASGALAPVRDDALGVVVDDASQSKIDWYLHPSYDYRVKVDAATGAATATVIARFRNDAPATGVPAYVIGGPPTGVAAPGRNVMLISVFTPLAVRSLKVDGVDVQPRPASTEQHRNVIEVFIDVGSGGTSEVRIELAGTLVPGPYQLALHHQPMVNPADVHVTVNGRTLFDGQPSSDLVIGRR